MKTRARAAVVSLISAIVAAALWVAPVAAADGGAPRIAPPVSHAYGNTLPGWLSIYWQWYWGTAQDLDESLVGRVQLMPLPAPEYVSGAGTAEEPALFVGELAITLRPGTPFVLPLIALTGERYEGYPGVPDDDPASFPGTTMSANLTIDGRTVVSDANVAAFLVPATYFDPIVMYPETTSYGSVAAVWFEGIGIVSPPLPVGVHVIHLDATLIVPGFFGLTYDNTWTVEVTPH